jgi:hypothetical protein
MIFLSTTLYGHVFHSCRDNPEHSRQSQGLRCFGDHRRRLLHSSLFADICGPSVQPLAMANTAGLR